MADPMETAASAQCKNRCYHDLFNVAAHLYNVPGLALHLSANARFIYDLLLLNPFRLASLLTVIIGSSL